MIEGLRQVQEGDALVFVIEAVPALGRDAARAVPRLVELVADPRRRVRIEAVRALGRVGPDASVALTDLEHLRRAVPETEATMRGALNEAIAAIRGDW
ncbi:MAG: HEAT repeat domain-containing protein [Planctomycetota bacterium]